VRAEACDPEQQHVCHSKGDVLSLASSTQTAGTDTLPARDGAVWGRTAAEFAQKLGPHIRTPHAHKHKKIQQHQQQARWRKEEGGAQAFRTFGVYGMKRGVGPPCCCR